MRPVSYTHLSQEGYGWKVDQEQEIAKIAEEGDAHAADAREPQYAQREFAASKMCIRDRNTC